MLAPRAIIRMQQKGRDASDLPQEFTPYFYGGVASADLRNIVQSFRFEVRDANPPRQLTIKYIVRLNGI